MNKYSSEEFIIYSFMKAIKDSDYECIIHLLNIGFDINHTLLDPRKSTALHIATLKQDTTMVKFLLAYGSDKQLMDFVEFEPYYYALRDNNMELQELLMIDNIDKNKIARSTMDIGEYVLKYIE